MSVLVFKPSRRDFLKAGAAASAGLVLGCRAGRGKGTSAAVVADAPPAPGLPMNAFVQVAPDNSVVVISKHLEMGQGVYTGLATIVAEELDADWSKMRVETAPADAKLYNNLFWGPAQGTGGSSSIANSWDQLRKAGATARAMLVTAAAEAWMVPAAEITTSNGVLSHRSGKRGTYGEFAERAGRLPVPADVPLKDPTRFRYVGKPVRRLDTRHKTNGKAQFTLDVKLPGMLTAVVLHPPLFGARPRSFDPTKAKAVRGVREVVQIPTGIAVLADGFWPAKQGRDALSAEWDTSAAHTAGTAELFERYRALAKRPGRPARKQGDAEGALRRAARPIEAAYDFPFLAHATMEPMNCVVQLGLDGCEIWNGDQMQTGDQAVAAAMLGLPPEKVKIHTLLAGGSFGRRANPISDYVAEAVSIAKAIGGRAPVKLVWTREDDMQAGWYRPLYHHTISAALDADGRPVAWRQRIVGQSIITGTPFEALIVKNGIDATSVEGASTLPYAIPNLQVELHTTELKVPVQWWRSVGHTHTAFSTETFIDELATAAGKDPFEFRRGLLEEHPRHKGVLELAAARSGWGSPLGPGSGRGIAVHESFGSFVAEVAEVTVQQDGGIKVDRVVCAVDCGLAVNPDVVRAQMEGGIGYGLSAVLHGEITLKEGRVEQRNFDGYRPLRFAEMPKVDVHIMESAAPPTGVGEPGVPPVGPAVANAIFAATGERIRSLPIGSRKFRRTGIA